MQSRIIHAIIQRPDLIRGLARCFSETDNTQRQGDAHEFLSWFIDVFGLDFPSVHFDQSTSRPCEGGVPSIRGEDQRFLFVRDVPTSGPRKHELFAHKLEHHLDEQKVVTDCSMCDIAQSV